VIGHDLDLRPIAQQMELAYRTAYESDEKDTSS